MAVAATPSTSRWPYPVILANTEPGPSSIPTVTAAAAVNMIVAPVSLTVIADKAARWSSRNEPFVVTLFRSFSMLVEVSLMAR